MKRKPKRIVFFNEPSSVDAYMRSGDTERFPDLIIGLYPSTRHYLNSKGVASKDTTQYFTAESHKRLLERSNEIISEFRKSCGRERFDTMAEEAQVNSFIFWVRILTLYFLRNIETISNAVDMHRPDAISASIDPKRPVFSAFVEPDESYMGKIASRVAGKSNIKFEKMPISGLAPVAAFVRGGCDRLKGLISFVFKYIAFDRWEKRILEHLQVTDKRPIVFTTRRYQMDVLASDYLKGEPGENIVFLEGPISLFADIPVSVLSLFGHSRAGEIANYRNVLKRIVSSVQLDRDLFSYRGISFSDLISQKLSSNITGHLLGQSVWAYRVDETLARLKPRIVISAGNRPDDAMIAELCKKRGIDTVLISHGSHVKPKNDYERIEWSEHGRSLLGSSFAVNAMQSPLVEEYFSAFPASGALARTGPLIWGRPIDRTRGRSTFNKIFGPKRDFDRTRVIVHAGTAKRSRIYVYETFDEYISALRDLARAVERLEDTVLVIKFRPIMELTTEALKEFVPFSDKVILSIDEKFSDVLAMADLLVSFSSTTIEEALQNKIPVLLYGGDGRYQHTVGFNIENGHNVDKRAVYHVEKPSDLGYALSGILSIDFKGAGNDEVFERYRYKDTATSSFADLVKT